MSQTDRQTDNTVPVGDHPAYDRIIKMQKNVT